MIYYNYIITLTMSLLAELIKSLSIDDENESEVERLRKMIENISVDGSKRLNDSKKRKKCEIYDIYEEDIDSDYCDDEEMEQMMSYYKSIIIDEIKDEETNTLEERMKLVSNFDRIKDYLQPPAKRIKLSVNIDMNNVDIKLE